MPDTWLFDSDKLDAALEDYGYAEAAATVREFLHSGAARKLRIQPSPPRESPGLRPQPSALPDEEDCRDA